MSALLAIDPGAATGVAMLFIGPGCPAVLMAADVLAPDDVGWAKYMPDIVVIEDPQIYPHSKARPNDIGKLWKIVGRYIERYKGASVRLVHPHEWKGSIDGDIMVRRIEAAMTPAELALLAPLPKGTRHNAVDAIGLAKWSTRQPWLRGVL
jgi:hypothetical protein